MIALPTLVAALDALAASSRGIHYIAGESNETRVPYASLRDPGYRGADFPALLAQVNRIAPGTTTIIDTPIWIAGNLALIAPDLTLSLSADPVPLIPSVIITDDPAKALAMPGVVARAQDPVAYTIQRGSHSMQVSIIALR